MSLTYLQIDKTDKLAVVDIHLNICANLDSLKYQISHI